MAREKNIELNTRLSREDVAGILEALSEGLKEGLLKVQKSGDTLELTVPRFVDLEVEAHYSEEEASFEIEVSWRPGRAEVTDYPGEEEGPVLGFRSGHISDNPELTNSPRSAEDTLRQTATTVGAVAKAASQKASKALSKAAGTTLQALEKAAGKTRQTVKEIKEEAERISAEKKAAKADNTSVEGDTVKPAEARMVKKASSGTDTAIKKTAPKPAASKPASKKNASKTAATKASSPKVSGKKAVVEKTAAKKSGTPETSSER